MPDMQSTAYRHYLLTKGSREELIDWLHWNDRGNGHWRDADSIREFGRPVTLEEARSGLREILNREHEEPACPGN